MKSLLYYLDNFTPEFLFIELAVLVIIFLGIIMMWLYNRKKYHDLAHQIPAGVIKNYLDSIIQNSNSLKSSLFRGGGADLGEGAPSVVSLGAAGGASADELNRKNAEIDSLRSQLNEKTGTIGDLENKVRALMETQGGGDDGAAQAKVIELSDQVAKLQSELSQSQSDLASAKEAGAGDGGGGGVSEDDHNNLLKERDDLKERLQEYEIIEDDLANLKSLQQENAQLKKALSDGGGSIDTGSGDSGGDDDGGGDDAPPPAASADAGGDEAAAEAPAEETPPPPEEAVAEEAPAEEVADAAPAPEAPPAEDSEAKEKEDDKNADDLLNEFEKMLE